MLKITEIMLRAWFTKQHGPKNGGPGRDLTQHRMRGTYKSPQIAALWNQHVRTAHEMLTLYAGEQEWFDPKLKLPDLDNTLVWVFDPENQVTIWPARWDAVNQSFTSSTGWFKIDEITAWTFAVVPTPPVHFHQFKKD